MTLAASIRGTELNYKIAVPLQLQMYRTTVKD